MNQDVFLYADLFDGNERASLELYAGRKGYVHVARGRAMGSFVTTSVADSSLEHVVRSIERRECPCRKRESIR